MDHHDLPPEPAPVDGVAQIRHRQDSLYWWAEQHRLYPLGIVTINTAVRMLGISHARMTALLDEKRFTIIEGLEHRGHSLRFVPVHELLQAPFDLNRGRPGLFGPKNRPNSHLEEKKYDHSKSLADRHLPRNPPK